MKKKGFEKVEMASKKTNEFRNFQARSSLKKDPLHTEHFVSIFFTFLTNS